MLIAAGQFPMAQLLDDFKLMAQNKNEKHEYNKKGQDFKHKDGWGIVIRSSGRLEQYKNNVACWEDPRFSEYRDITTDLVILHARKAPQVNYNFTHPFQREGWYFCHNGTIHDFNNKEKTDSEQFFIMFLDILRKETDVKDAIRRAINNTKSYSALNFILTNGEKAYILNKHRKDRSGEEHPQYYTMKYLKNENCVIISSEVLPNFSGEWVKIENNSLIELDLSSLEIMNYVNV